MQPAFPRTDRPICALAVDAEEDFDWLHPVQGTGYSTACMRNTRVLQEIAKAYGIVPTYLLTYPVLEDAEVVRILRRLVDRGECAVGVQLHPWVTPPFDEISASDASYCGNLAPDLEERKLVTLASKFADCFGSEPKIYRAGRYGLSWHTASTLEKLGFTIDTSLAPRSTFAEQGGPDYTGYDYRPFWFGERYRLLGLPLCRSIVGWGGALAPRLYQALSRTTSLSRLRATALLTRSRCAERITLSPEGNDLGAMIRFVRRLHAGGHRIFVLSFHSSSLAVGRNPYVRTKAELHTFFDRLSGILDFMATHQAMRFASLAQIPMFLEAPVP